MLLSLNSRPLAPWLPWLLLLGVTTLLHFGHGYPLLRLELRPVQWRWLYTVFTCHLVHLTTQHWLHNSLALLILAGIFARCYRWQVWWVGFVTSALTISLGMLWFQPQWHSYAGLSGVLHGLFAMGCLLLYRVQPRLAIALGILLLLKLSAEVVFGAFAASVLAFPVARAAHGYGVIGGVLGWTICYRLRRC